MPAKYVRPYSKGNSKAASHHLGDIGLRQGHARAEDLQQHSGALMAGHAVIDAEMPLERTAPDPHLVATLQWAPGKFDQAVAFALPNSGNRRLGQPRWSASVEHQARNTRRPARTVPLQMDVQEALAGEQRTQHAGPAAADDAALADAWVIDRIAGELEAMQRARRQSG